MKKLTHLLFALICLCMPALSYAQDKDDSHYLAGAVPEVEGKVIFTKEFSIPGMSQDEIYDRLFNWMDARLKKNENNSRIVFSDKAKGQIIGIGDEWIVFSSTALSLDRTKITYQLVINSQPEKCTLEIEKIRFNYREGQEKYTAEEWITDKYALNKDKTKLVRGLAKWRRKTVDFADNLAQEVAEALSAATIQPQVEEIKEEEKAKAAPAGPIVIAPKKQVTVEAPKNTVEAPKNTEAQAEKVVIPATPLVPATKVEPAKEPEATAPATPATPQGYKQVAPDQLPADAIQTGAGKLVIVIGNDAFNMTMMTANSGGSLGKVNGKPVVFCILSPDQSYEQMEKAENYTVRFYPTGTTEPTVVLECNKLPSPATMEGMPRTYVGEIVKATIK